MKSKLVCLVSLALIAALVLPAAMGEAADSQSIEAMLNAMTLEEKVGQMMFVSFRVWKEMPEAGSDGNTTVENAEEEIPA